MATLACTIEGGVSGLTELPHREQMSDEKSSKAVEWWWSEVARELGAWASCIALQPATKRFRPAERRLGSSQGLCPDRPIAVKWLII